MNKKIVLSLTVVALVLVGYLLFFQQNQPTLVPEVNTQVQTEVKYSQRIEAITGTDEMWYSIPEIGAQMQLNKDFAEELIYKYVHEVTDDSKEEWDAVYFSTKSLASVDNGCFPEEGSPLGVITKLGKDAQESAKNYNENYFSGPNRIQIGDDYYVWTGPQATCWDPKNDVAVQQARSAKDYSGSGAKNVSDGLKTIQSIPSK